jgi:hypothetical protein
MCYTLDSSLFLEPKGEPMLQILIRIEESEAKQIQDKATEFGLSKTAFIRQILREYLRKPAQKEQPVNDPKYVRALIPVLAEALCWTQNQVLKEDEKVIPKEIKELSNYLIKLYDKEVQK